MEQNGLKEAAERIGRMERCFDILQSAAITDPAAFREDTLLQERLQELIAYYENGQWLQDYELDEKGLLPPDLKRGVLSQDAVYNFLESVKTDT